LSKKRKKQKHADYETWACGDCGTEYSYSVDYCTETGLDHAYLALRREIPIKSQRRAAYPIYFSVAQDLNIAPPLPSGERWAFETNPFLAKIHFEGREAS